MFFIRFNSTSLQSEACLPPTEGNPTVPTIMFPSEINPIQPCVSMSSCPTLSFIDEESTLADFCASLSDSAWIAVDTEFLREKTYFPKFCLLQIAGGNRAACIDPLAISNLEPVRALLYNPAITKVFHAGRQDLEIFYLLWQALPMPLFDTQIAAPLLGLQEQIGYAGLVHELLGVSLGKGHTRTDWATRPLSEAQLQYAADDVIYLGAAYQAMHGKLEALDRLTWLDEDFAALAYPGLYELAPEDAWQRIGGVQQLRGRQLAALQALAAWREETARKLDIPRSWVLKDEIALDLVRLAPKTPEDLSRIRGLDERAVKRYGVIICRLLADSQHRPSPVLDIRIRPSRKTPEQEALLDVLNAVVRLRAAQHSLNPNLLATRRDLELLLEDTGEGTEHCRLLKGWRNNLVGEELSALLHGEFHIALSEGKLQLRHDV